MVIRNHKGDICGRVVGKNTISTEDAALEHLWKEQVTVVPYRDTTAWKEKVAGILSERGYSADIVE
jgi:hypothetical protein